MKFLINHITQEVLYVIAVTYAVLILCTTSFFFLNKYKPSKLSGELLIKTRSWWYIATGTFVVITAQLWLSTLIVAYVSFVALREMLSNTGMREEDRGALLIAYISIPIQYYLCFINSDMAIFFIPVFIFIAVAFALVLTGETKKVGRQMAIIPTLVMLTVYLLSHLILILRLEIPNYNLYSGALVIYLIMLTSFNDVFQFTWGKLLGRNKIIPKVSPNKTWEGFIGGVLTTSALAVGLKFLTPLSLWQAIAVGLIVGLAGFIGDAIISAIKRDWKVKDTDNIIPGHGGAMDRLDSIVITAPVFYHLLIYFTS